MALQQIGLKAVFDLSDFNRGYNDYLNKLGRANSETSGIVGRLNSQFLGLGTGILKVAGFLSGALVVGATAAGVAIGKMALDGLKDAMSLEQSVANIAAVLNITTEQADFLKETILDLGIDPTLRVSTEQAGEALYVLAQAGIFTGMTLEEMETAAYDAGKAVVMLANATGADFDQASAIATDAMTLFNVSASDMVAVVSDITSVVTTSKFTIDDYELALRNGGATAAQYGVSLREFNTAVAASAEELGSGRRAGTGMLNFLNRLTPNTQKATDLMAELGFIVNGNNQFFDQQTGELKDLSDISVMLNDVLYGQVAVVKQVGGRTAEQTEILTQMVAEYQKAEQTMFDYTRGANSLIATEDEKADAIAEAQSVMAKLGPTINELNGITGEYSVSLETMRAEQRMVALETLFGNDGMKTAIALANEGAQANLTAAEVMDVFGVNMQEANAMIADGITNWQVLQANMGKTDAIQNAITRTDTLKAKWENMKDAWTAAKIQALDPLMAALEKIVDERIVPFIQNSDDLIAQAQDIGQAFADLLTAVVDTGTFYEPFLKFLADIGQADVATKIDNIREAILALVIPIKEFVEKHKDGFIGAFKAIGTLAAASVIYTIATAIGILVAGIGGLIAVVGVLGFAWAENWGNIQGITESAVNQINEALDAVGILDFVDELKSAFNEGGFSGLVESIPEAFSGLGQSIVDFLAGIDWVALGTTIRDNLFAQMRNLGELAGEALTWFSDFINSVDWNTVGKQLFDLFIGFIILNFVVNETIIEALFNFFKTVIDAVDWSALATGLTTMLFGLFQGAFNAQTQMIDQLVFPFLESLLARIVAWGSSQGETFVAWASESVIQPILTGLMTFAEKVPETLSTWWEAINTWFTQTITWENLAYWVTTALLTVFVGFPMQIGQTLLTWWTAFSNWVTTTNWTSLGETIKTKIKDSLELFGKVVLFTLNNWWKNIHAWFTGQPWDTLGDEVKTSVDTSLSEFWTDTKESFNAWWEGVKTWFETTTWDSLGETVIEGVKDGLNAKAQELIDTLTGIAAGAKAAWDAFWQSQSPSQLMDDSGQDIVDGLVRGIHRQTPQAENSVAYLFGAVFGLFEDEIDTFTPLVEKFTDMFAGIEDIFEFGSGVSGIAGGFASQFERLIIEPMKEATSQLEKEHESLASELATSTGIDLSREQLLTVAGGRDLVDEEGNVLLDPTDQQIGMAQRLLDVEHQIFLEKEKITAEEEKVLALKEQQADFEFLKQQMDLLKFIEENELNAGDILGGITLGLDADIAALLEAMTAAMQAVVETAETELGIASPSRVFAGIGTQIMNGLAEGLALDNALKSAQSNIGGFVSSVNGMLPNNRQPVAQGTGNQTVQNFNLNNNFSGSPQITDVDTLRMTLAGYI